MSTNIERNPTDQDRQRISERIDQTCHHLMEMFAAVCAAPDDPTVAAQANEALRELECLLAVV
jgi:hypothetical protein